MISLYLPEIGHFCLILSFIFALLPAMLGLPMICCRKRFGEASLAIDYLVVGAYAQAGWLFLAYLFLTVAFVVNDFSVYYVAQEGHRLQPLVYRISAVWGAHEGSVLLWTLFLSGWGAAFAFFSKTALLPRIRAYILWVMASLSTGFLSFLLFTSNPFLRNLPTIPLEGKGLNPLLQDPGLASHPPLLYMGYVGFALSFAFAMAALIEGELDERWVKCLKPWVLLAWSFLTLGITLGSWWAYRVLGWGGWWFWDPVENAALLPWLSGTALLHSLLMVEKRGAFKAWTLLLAIITFCLSLLGTFLVRSGVLISVHAFATDPLRGAFLLKFLWVSLGGAFILFGWRAPRLIQSKYFAFFSKESFLLINNLLLFILMLSVLFGTLYPLFLDALGQGKVSVGPPYFNLIFLPLALPLLLAMSVGTLCQWQKTPVFKIWQQMRTPLVFALGLALIFGWFFSLSGLRSFSLFLVFLLMAVTLKVTVGHFHFRFGMFLAHLGVGCCALGIILSTALQTQLEVRVAPGETISMGRFNFHFQNLVGVQGKNYEGVAAQFRVSQGSRLMAEMYPEKRRYVGMESAIGQAAIDTNVFRDLYVVLGEPLSGESWSVRLYQKPFVRFIWMGGIMMGLGGLMALWQRVIRKRKEGV